MTNKFTYPTVGEVNYSEGIKDALERVVNQLGGFSHFLTPGDRVLIKPNLNTGDKYPGSSDTESIIALADLCHDHGAGEVIIADSSTLWADTLKVMEEIALIKLVGDRPWLKLVDLDQHQWIRREIPGAKFMLHVSTSELLDQVDRVFFLCCLKTHWMAQYTGALKLAVGLMPAKERFWVLHTGHLQEKVAELASVVRRPDLTIMDARTCFITGGPMDGTRRDPGLILASKDRVALDIEGVKIIQGFPGNTLAGLKPEELPQIARALELGVDQNKAN
jgi:uncharacterized protein (DUF362 family)